MVYKDYEHVVLSYDITMNWEISYQYHLNIPGRAVIKENNMENFCPECTVSGSFFYPRGVYI